VEVTLQAVSGTSTIWKLDIRLPISFNFYFYFLFFKIAVLHVGEGSNLDPSPVYLACQHSALVLLVHCDQRGGGLTFVVVGTVGQAFVARGDATKLVYLYPMNKTKYNTFLQKCGAH
jgi:hypothetical protein